MIRTKWYSHADRECITKIRERRGEKERKEKKKKKRTKEAKGERWNKRTN